jgi:hypothetical protein
MTKSGSKQEPHSYTKTKKWKQLLSEDENKAKIELDLVFFLHFYDSASSFAFSYLIVVF